MVGADDNATAHLLDGLRSAQQEPHGWNRVILPRLDFRAVTRLNDSTLSIRLPQAAHYQVEEPETVTLSLSAHTLTSNLPLVATPSIVLRATAGSAVLSDRSSPSRRRRRCATAPAAARALDPPRDGQRGGVEPRRRPRRAAGARTGFRRGGGGADGAAGGGGARRRHSLRAERGECLWERDRPRCARART